MATIAVWATAVRPPTPLRHRPMEGAVVVHPCSRLVQAKADSPMSLLVLLVPLSADLVTDSPPTSPSPFLPPLHWSTGPSTYHPFTAPPVLPDLLLPNLSSRAQPLHRPEVLLPPTSVSPVPPTLHPAALRHVCLQSHLYNRSTSTFTCP